MPWQRKISSSRWRVRVPVPWPGSSPRRILRWRCRVTRYGRWVTTAPRVRGRRSGATAAEPSPGTGGAESLVHPAPRDRSRGDLPDEEGSLLPRQEEHGAGESVADCGGAAGSGVAEHPHAGVTSPAKFDSNAPANASAAPASAQLVPVAPTSAAKFDSHAPANGTAPPALAEPAPTADLTPLRQPALSAGAIPAAVRRALWQRDQARCAYVDPLTGRRCTSQHLLQIDHLQPVARGGGADLTNLRL